MKIAESRIVLDSVYIKEHTIKEQEHLQSWVDTKEDKSSSKTVQTDTLRLSREYTELDAEDVSLDPKLMQIVRALEILTGKKIDIKTFIPHDSVVVPVEGEFTPKEADNRQGWGIDYSYERIEKTSQKLGLTAQGKVMSENGKEIEFQLALSMKQEFIRYDTFSFKAGDALIDPLVINFGDTSVTFSDVRTTLDLDKDGIKEEFRFLSSGSGFLTLDKNGDGIVNDGSELFGPNGSDGFSELRSYDEDANGWIDENDTVFDKLYIWTKDKQGNDSFYSLKDVGIGALYLESVATPFEFQGGNLAKSSVFLREDGSAGMIGEVDLKV